jgi:hypothetical protein
MNSKEKLDTCLTIEEKRAWLARIFRDTSGEYSDADKLKALEADNRLAAMLANCQEKIDNSRYCKDCAHFRPFEKNKNFGKCARYIGLDWIGAYDDCTHCRFYEEKD